MTGKVQVEIAGLRSTAGGLDDVASRIRAIHSEIASTAASYDGCWGDDEFGRPFAEGDHGYNARNVSLQGVLGQQAQRLVADAQGLKDGATALETTETDNTDGFRS
ncbi:hypothetical protein [Nocardia aurantia]|uniref:WXG100 family type VII secretion target n=1 Tax=Nocardia aurantia TaxID=2585199 RepID=A0A7K0DH34_9NOCA|nr:hypothetical protein [Nocardia aurantia]MQY24999.1 hypothetical protein [Nocardia aurantia]